MRPSCLSPASQIRLAADFQRYSTSDDDSGCVMDEYAWVPSGCKPDMVHSYFSSLPNDKVPYVNSAGEQWRVSQLKRQLPPQDSDPSYCLSLSEAEAQQLLQFEAVRKRQCLGKGVIRPHLPFENQRRYCHQCKQSFSADDMVIEAPERFGSRAFWHPKCFVCVECTELLVDLIYFKHNDNVFCGRHHAEQLKPRCAGCDELIFNEECTEAEGRMWHMKHFACSDCNCQLGGLRYVVKDTRPFCISCYNQLPQAIQCNTCGGEIEANEPRITQGEVHWHTDERCFACIGCAKKLLGSKKYSIIGNGLYCGPNGCERRIRRAKNGDNQRNFGPISARFRGSDPDQTMRGDVSPGYARNSGNSSMNGGVSPRNGLNTPVFASKPISPMPTVDTAHLRPPGPPPLRSPPLPPQTSFHQPTPPENIYETVALPETKPRRFRRRVNRPVVTDDSEVEEWDSTSSCSSSNWQHARTHRNRRSLSMDGCTAKLNNTDGCSYDDLALEEMNLKNGRSGRRARPQNFYSGMPPNFGRRSSYTTTSESDSEDEIYMGKYDSVNVLQTPRRRPAQRQVHYEKQPIPTPNPTSVRRRPGPKQLNARRIKNKSNSNCIVS